MDVFWKRLLHRTGAAVRRVRGRICVGMVEIMVKITCVVEIGRKTTTDMMGKSL